MATDFKYRVRREDGHQRRGPISSGLEGKETTIHSSSNNSSFSLPSKMATMATKLRRADGRKSSPYLLGRYSTASGLLFDVCYKRDKGRGPHYRLLFLHARARKLKMGFLLFQENKKEGTLAFKGMKVSDDFRGRGLSKLFLAIWIVFTVSQGLIPNANIIEKPVLSLLLLRFEFFPLNKKNCFKLAPPSSNQSLLWTENPARFHQAFSRKARTAQEIRLLPHKPEKAVTVYTSTGYFVKNAQRSLELAKTELSDGRMHWFTGSGVVLGKSSDSQVVGFHTAEVICLPHSKLADHIIVDAHGFGDRRRLC